MALIQSSRPSSGGGGGGLAIRGWWIDSLTQNTNFVAGSIIFTLSQAPPAGEALAVTYNGQTLIYGVGYSYNSGTNAVTILFADPYVTDYDTPPIFQFQYPYL